jgi:Zn finger protein HypA/HybF involved in hydrogenase expression
LALFTLDISQRMAYSYEDYPIKGGVPMEAYCMKCRAKREMKDTKAITMKNGKPATQGVCPKCGTKMFRIGKG